MNAICKLGSVCLVALFPFTAFADDPTTPTDPIFVVRLTDGSKIEGRIRQIGPDQAVVLDPVPPASEGGVPAGVPEPRRLPLIGISSLVHRDADPPASPPSGSVVLFPGGDRLRAIIGPATATGLTVLPPAFGDVATEIPLDRILGVVLAPPGEPEEAADLLADLRSRPRTSELLWLSNGDRLVGSLLEIGASTIKFEPDTGPIDVPRSSVVAIGFDPALVVAPPEVPLLVELTFSDGTRLGVEALRLEKGQLVARTRFGSEVRARIASVSRIHVRSAAVAYLSEQKEAASEFVGYLGDHPGRFGRDSTWDGHTLRLAGQPYDRGLGMLPRTLVAYRLDPRDRRFQATIGLDERAGPRGSVVFRVLVDGKPRYESPPLSRRTPPVDLDLEVQGGRLLILVAEFGEGGDVQDSADWAEARLIRAPE